MYTHTHAHTRSHRPFSRCARACVRAAQKLPRETVLAELAALGVPASACDALTAAMALRTVDELAALLGEEAEAVADLRALWALAEGAWAAWHAWHAWSYG
jgi:histidyl-tRNA synthetase